MITVSVAAGSGDAGAGVDIGTRLDEDLAEGADQVECVLGARGVALTADTEDITRQRAAAGDDFDAVLLDESVGDRAIADTAEERVVTEEGSGVRQLGVDIEPL